MKAERLTYDEKRLEALRIAFRQFANARIFTPWRWATRDGKFTKVPTHPAGRPGIAFDEALSAFQRDQTLAGLGVQLGTNSKGTLVLFGVDYDGNEKGPLPEGFPETTTYKERTPSGEDRFHILGVYEGKPLEGKRKGAVEIYTAGRFFTLTGDRISGAEIVLTDPLPFYHSLAVSDPQPYGATASTPGVRGVQITEGDLTDREREFLDVVRGIDNKDKSSRDFAVCATLAERGASDEEIAHVLCAPGFWRPKLGSNRTYIQRTIAKAREAAREDVPAPPTEASVKAYGEAHLNAPESSAATGPTAPTPESSKAFREKSRAIGEGDEPKVIPVQYTLESMLDEAVFIKEGSQVALLSDPRVAWSFPDFENATAASKHKSGGKGRPTTVAKKWIEDPKRITVETRTFLAGGSPFCKSPDDLKAINTWREPPRIPPPADWKMRATQFLVHVAFLIPDRKLFELFLDWLAHLEQRPGELPHWHWLMFTRMQGIGRNLLSAILARVWPGVTALDVDLAALLDGGFNGRLSRKVLAVVNEIREGSGGGSISHRRAEKMKAYFTDQQRHINPKYGREYVEYNSTRWLMFSNHENALPLNPNDRRVCVVENPAQPKDPSYYATLYALVGDNHFIASVRELLRARNISGFNPGMVAPLTEAKRKAIDAGMSEADLAMAEVMKDHPADCITTEDLAIKLFGSHASDRDRSAMRYIAGDAGAQKYKDKVRLYPGGRQYRVWVIRNHSKWLAKATAEVVKHIKKHKEDEAKAAVNGFHNAADGERM